LFVTWLWVNHFCGIFGFEGEAGVAAPVCACGRVEVEMGGRDDVGGGGVVYWWCNWGFEGGWLGR